MKNILLICILVGLSSCLNYSQSHYETQAKQALRTMKYTHVTFTSTFCKESWKTYSVEFNAANKLGEDVNGKVTFDINPFIDPMIESKIVLY